MTSLELSTIAILRDMQCWSDSVLEAWLRSSLRAGRFAPLPLSKTTPDVLYLTESIRRYGPALQDRFRPMLAALIGEWGPHDGRPMLRDILILASELRAAGCCGEIEALLRSPRLEHPRALLARRRARAEGCDESGLASSAPASAEAALASEQFASDLEVAEQQLDLIKLALNVVAGVGPRHVSESWLLSLFDEPDLMPLAYSALYRRDIENAIRLFPVLVETLQDNPLRLGLAIARLLTEHVQQNEVRRLVPRLLQSAAGHWEVVLTALGARGVSLRQVDDPRRLERFQLFRALSHVLEEAIGDPFEAPDGQSHDVRALGECLLRATARPSNASSLLQGYAA